MTLNLYYKLQLLRTSSPPSKQTAFKQLCLVRLHFIFIGCILPAMSHALDTSKIPLLAIKPNFNIELAISEDNENIKGLLKLLKAELTHQRQTNQQLKQFSKQNKAARYEAQLLSARLRAEGYYAAKVRFKIQGEKILYKVAQGLIYRIQKLSYQIPEGIKLLPNNVELMPGDPLRAEDILSRKKSLASYITNNFCLYHVHADYRVKIDHQTQQANVTFIVESSPNVLFGDITFSGLQSIDEDYLKDRLPIKEGQCFKRNRIDIARLMLIQTNLLVSASAEVGQPENNRVPIRLDVIERFHRTLSAGVDFESDEGFGISAGWEHRNLKGRAEKLIVDGHLAENTQSLSSSLTFPHFRRNNQAVTLYTDLQSENTDAFKSNTAALGAELSRQLSTHLRGLLGTELALSEVTEDISVDSFSMLSVPFSLEYDRRSDPLDPLSGWVAAGRIRPYWNTQDTSKKFVKSTFAASTYMTFDKAYWRPTIAIRGALGSISGIDRDEVPANIRFYTGGGGSVRGYAFQSLGTLTKGDPDGGLSFSELSVEARLRWSENWGGVVFVDGGFAYEDALPKLGQELLWGAGVGIRYYTSFAPIRLDIAAPLDKREGIDDSFQIYISIGQAF